MEHAVHHRGRDGASTFEEVDSLDAAVALVERLRNDEDVSDVRVYRQVPIEFHTYYKVTVVDGADASGDDADATTGPAADLPPVPAAAAVAPPPQPPVAPPPGAMPLDPEQPVSRSATDPVPADPDLPAEPSEEHRRGSLFSRG